MGWTEDERVAAAERFADRRIFVSLIGVDDRVLAETIDAAIAAAERPSMLRFGVCSRQRRPGTDALDRFADDPRVSLDRVELDGSHGGGWARARANARFDAERYVLLLDPPVRFAHAWDRGLIELLSSTGSARPIITAASPVATVGDRSEPAEFGGEPGGRPEPTGRLDAGLLFTRGRFVVDVPAHGEVTRADEDLALSVRAYTHGYDAFGGGDRFVRREVAPAEDADGADRALASRQVVDRLLAGDDHRAGPLGLGCLRSAAAYRDLVRRQLAGGTTPHATLTTWAM